tara:strand:+ start:1262 stop:1804 length:543 start_codon:yes stop_codon:yes gene_type:complete
MVEVNKQEPNEFEKRGINPFNNPTPGEGLTRSPDERFPWEQAPRFTEMKPAIEEIFLTISEKEPLIELIGLLQSGTPVDEIAQVILYKGMTSGAFNMDLMLMLVEPTMYLLIAIAEEYEIEPVIYEGQDDDLIDEEDYRKEKDRQTLGKKLPEVRKDSVPESLLQRVKTLPEKEELGIEE